jgi:cytoskeletal protein CcmA (bactofilin family)
MENAPANGNTNVPQPEELKARTEGGAAAPGQAAPPPTSTADPGKKAKRRTYRPSHKATFIGLAAVIAILAINAAVIGFLLKKQAKNDGVASKGQVSLSNADLNKLGINRNTIGDSGSELLVSPNAQFKGKLSVAGDTTLSGQLSLNGKLSGTSASLAQLQAGKTSLSELDVNGNSTVSSLNLRKDLVVAGNTQLQGTVNLSQLLTVNNSANITGNLSVGGTLTVSTFSARSLTSTSTLTIGGHIITNGLSPSLAPGNALGSNGTASVSGNDAAGVIAINIGVGASGGTLASIAFHNQYASVPRVVITPVGVGGEFFIFSLTSSGFSVGVNSGLPPGGYRINFIAMQ